MSVKYAGDLYVFHSITVYGISSGYINTVTRRIMGVDDNGVSFSCKGKHLFEWSVMYKGNTPKELQ